MAGEAATGNDNLDPQVVAPEELKGPEDDGSLASIMEKATPIVFTGHPAMGEEGEGEPGEPDPDDPGGTPGETHTEGGKPPEGEEIPEGWEFKPKYKDHKTAEEGAREHQRKVTEATEETKKEREAREAAERERDELRQKLTEKETVAKPPDKPAETTKTPEELEAEQESRIETALNEIDQIDEFDPDYKKKVARAWRKAGIGGSGQPAIPTGKALDDLISQRVEEQFQARERTEAEAKAKETKAEESSRVRTKAGELAGKSGLNMEEGSADHILFWSQVDRMPKELDGKPFEEQVQWTVNEVRRLKGEVVQSKEEKEARARKAQTENAVLERGGDRPKKPAAPEPYTLGSIMNQHQQRRRI
jgi:hypothetical protein